MISEVMEEFKPFLFSTMASLGDSTWFHNSAVIVHVQPCSSRNALQSPACFYSPCTLEVGEVAPQNPPLWFSELQVISKITGLLRNTHATVCSNGKI